MDTEKICCEEIERLNCENAELRSDMERLTRERADLREKFWRELYGLPNPTEIMKRFDLAALAEKVPFQKAGNGWAPGNYPNKCCVCGGLFVGDKQAVCCPGCASAGQAAEAEARRVVLSAIAGCVAAQGRE